MLCHITIMILHCVIAQAWTLRLHDILVSCPARMRLPVINSLVNEVEFLGLITQTW